MTKEESIKKMQEAFKLYKKEKSGVKPLSQSMKELSAWLFTKEN